MSTAGHGEQGRAALPVLIVGAIGVVFGDIGTSPLYALKECFAPGHGAPLNPQNLLGILSLIFWSVLVVVGVKYVSFIMRADNKGEGGILALLALVLRLTSDRPRLSFLLATLGVFGATLFYGDAVITPAISVLSAVEGLEVITPVLKPYVVPTTLVLLIGLFVIQRYGTARVGGLFGPITLVWFVTLGVLGAVSVVQNPEVLVAASPTYALGFVFGQPGLAFLAMGAVVLAVTGTEALYADMGHFGRRPIRIAWFALVWPCLLMNYFGQGALLLRDPASVKNPFYLLAPYWFLAPLVGLATAATVIASQATISGAFSLTRQAIQLGYLPRMRILHTSAREIGQIYVPLINWLLLAGVVFLVLEFRSSSGLAAAYGIAVTAAMMVDSILVAVVMLLAWRWSSPVVALLVGGFLVIDLAFLGANAMKIVTGGWLPLMIAGLLFTLLTTWRRGRQILAERQRADAIGRDDFINIMSDGIPRVFGTAIFMTGARSIIPGAMLHNLKHNKVLHDRIVFLTVETQDVPAVPDAERIDVKDLGKGFHRVVVRYGFMQQPDVPAALALCARKGLEFEMMECTFFVGRESVIPSAAAGMALWREHIFAWLMRNAGSATDFFRIPANRVVEVGTQLEI